MTVCVAAISQQTIVGASDRMLTSGDIEFEPPISKLHNLTPHICIMIAGDISLQAEILHTVNRQVRESPETKWSVRDIADLYYSSFEAIRRIRAQREILHPLGLDYADLYGMQSDLAVRLSSDILNFQLPAIEALVTGRDDTGSHIYQVGNGGTSCQDWVAFASIGVGANHANSQIMFAGHNRGRYIADTMFLVYSAKKRAEVAPGVGKATDMFIIEPGADDEYFDIGQHVIDGLDEAYKEMMLTVEIARMQANGRANEFIQAIIQSNVANTQTIEADTGQREISAGDNQSESPSSSESS